MRFLKQCSGNKKPGQSEFYGTRPLVQDYEVLEAVFRKKSLFNMKIFGTCPYKTCRTVSKERKMPCVENTKC
jgi:hypothetical protein